MNFGAINPVKNTPDVAKGSKIHEFTKLMFFKILARRSTISPRVATRKWENLMFEKQRIYVWDSLAQDNNVFLAPGLPSKHWENATALGFKKPAIGKVEVPGRKMSMRDLLVDKNASLPPSPVCLIFIASYSEVSPINSLYRAPCHLHLLSLSNLSSMIPSLRSTYLGIGTRKNAVRLEPALCHPQTLFPKSAIWKNQPKGTPRWSHFFVNSLFSKGGLIYEPSFRMICPSPSNKMFRPKRFDKAVNQAVWTPGC